MTKDNIILSPQSSGRRSPLVLPEIKGFLETSFIDWRGQVAAVVFLPGCNFNCPYCHNHVLVHQPQTLETLPLTWILERLKSFQSWIDGVVVSGGEPTMHSGLPELLSVLRTAGFKTKLDTNGSQPQVLEQLLTDNLLDMISMDWKAPLDPLLFRRVSGVRADLDNLRRSRDIIIGSGLDYEFRSTIWPAWHGRPELLRMRQELSNARCWTLQALTTQNLIQDLGPGQPYTSQELAALQMELAGSK